MAKLTDPTKQAIVQALACFDTPSQVVERVQQEFGLTVSRMQVASYDPTKASGRNLSAKLRAVFEETRKAFLADTAAIPVAQQAFRMRALQRELERAQGRGNSTLVAQLLEQAAKEVGGFFTNRRELTGKNGGPIAQHNMHGLTDAQLEAIAAGVTPEQLAQAVRTVREEF